jgi:hypothetical protein
MLHRSTGRIRKGGVIGVFAEEVTVVAAVSRTGKGSRVTKRLRKVNLNEIPTWSKCVSESVGNKKEAIRRGLDGSVKRSSSNQRDRNNRVVVWKNWDSRVSWDGSGRWHWKRRVRVRNIGELEQRRMVGAERGREPHVVVHLNIDWGAKRMRERSVWMIEVSEIQCIDRCTRENSWWKRGQSLSEILDNGSSRITIRTDEIRSETCNFNDFVRAAPTISKFSDSTQFFIAGNLDTGCDEITDMKSDNRARFVGAFTVDSTTFFS